MSSHTLPTPLRPLDLPITRESTALWSTGTCKSCVIFVHGFGGRAITTWGDFITLLPEIELFKDFDLIFLGYESRTRDAPYNSAVLHKAILKLITLTDGDESLAVNRPARGTSCSYDKIVLVGHSLGAALIRDVAMIAKSQQQSWADTVSLVFFAPAHNGANIIKLAELALSGPFRFIPLIKAALIYKFPVLEDLKIGSLFLTNIIQRSEKIGKHCTTVAKLIVHASDDKIVIKTVFGDDPQSTPYEGHGHVTCCKPIKDVFLLPIDDLKQALN